MLCSTSWSVGTVARCVSRYRGAGGATLHRGSRTSCVACNMRHLRTTLIVISLGGSGGDGGGFLLGGRFAMLTSALRGKGTVGV